jgi:hypothetical protein
MIRNEGDDVWLIVDDEHEFARRSGFHAIKLEERRRAVNLAHCHDSAKTRSSRPNGHNASLNHL